MYYFAVQGVTIWEMGLVWHKRGFLNVYSLESFVSLALKCNSHGAISVLFWKHATATLHCLCHASGHRRALEVFQLGLLRSPSRLSIYKLPTMKDIAVQLLLL